MEKHTCSILKLYYDCDIIQGAVHKLYGHVGKLLPHPLPAYFYVDGHRNNDKNIRIL